MENVSTLSSCALRQNSAPRAAPRSLGTLSRWEHESRAATPRRCTKRRTGPRTRSAAATSARPCQ
eukprot:1037031-Pleurochrysis_carterae.AAC.6